MALAKAFYFVRFALLFSALAIAGCAEHTTAVLQTVRQAVSRDNSAAADAFTRSDPYHVNQVWERVQIHGYNKKRGTPIASRRSP